MLRRALIAAAACTVAGVVGAPAFGAVPPPPTRPFLQNSLSTAHFTVHYDSDKAQGDYLTQTQAGEVAALAEHALAVETGWGYQAPVDDGDGRYDIYVVDLSAFPHTTFAWMPDAWTAPASGSIDLAKTVADGDDLQQHAIAAAVFALIEFRYWVPLAGSESEDWLVNGPALSSTTTPSPRRPAAGGSTRSTPQPSRSAGRRSSPAPRPGSSVPARSPSTTSRRGSTARRSPSPAA